jgi:hypothetical protein
MCVVIPISVGNRSIEGAPKNPATSLVLSTMYCTSSGFRNRSAVAEHDDVWMDGVRGVAYPLNSMSTVFEGGRRHGADRAPNRQTHLRDEDVCVGLGHRRGVLSVDHIRRSYEIQTVRQTHHLDLERVPHSRLLEVLAKRALQ